MVTVEARHGLDETEVLTLTFPEADPGISQAFTCSGRFDAPALIEFFNSQPGGIGVCDGVSGFAPMMKPFAVLHALRVIGFELIMPEDWQEQFNDTNQPDNGENKEIF